MADDTARMSGSHEVEDQLMKMTQPTEIRPNKLRGGDGLTNGHSHHMESQSDFRSTHRSERLTSTMSFSSDRQVTVLKETVLCTRSRFVTEFDDVNDSFIQNMNIEHFLDYVERQRLTYMPQRGSRWDKVLKWTEYFALQISGYAKAVESFVPDANIAAKLIWTACRALLELGPENSQALEVTFGVFYQLGLSISILLRQNSLLHIDGHGRAEVGAAFNDLLTLVREVSIYYRMALTHNSYKETSLDFNNLFGERMENFGRRKTRIVDAMWEYALGDEASTKVSKLRKWLSSPDRNLRKLYQSRNLAPTPRHEYTCEWFQSHLLAFSRSKQDILAISGPAGSGKSTLCGWIIERLQRPLGKKTHETLTYHVEADVLGETTSYAMAKKLVLQLLEKDIGDHHLFREIEKVYDIAMTTSDSKLEEATWKCLDVGLDHFKGTGNVMIIADGLDNIRGGEKAAKAVAKHLGSLALKHSNVQLILFSQGAVAPSKQRTQNFQITSDHTHDDLRSVMTQALAEYKYFRVQSEHGREALVEKLLYGARGNFLWGILTVASLKQESSHDSFMKAVDAAKQNPKSLDETITKLVDTLDIARSDTSLLLSWMLVAERPLTIAEVKCLLQIDLQRKISMERKSDVEHDVSVALGPLAVIQNGFLRFRHSVIRSNLIRIQAGGKKLFDYRAAQNDLTMRLLLYCKLNLADATEPTFEITDRTELENLWAKHALLQYAVRNWTFHFRCCSMHQTAGSLQVSAEFKALFPASPKMAILEWACWDLEKSGFDAIHTQELALHVREHVFTEKHDSVVQSLIICGSTYRKTSKSTESAACFYRASRIGQLVLRKNHSVTVTCTTTFLAITEILTITSRTELATRKEEMLRFIINVYIHQYSKTHDLVIRYYKMLAQLYVDIKEEHNAEKIWRELREIITVRFGKGTEEEISISEQLTIVLKKRDNKTDVVEYEKGIFDMAMELEVWDSRRIKLTIELAVSYEARGEVLMAEELYIMLWRRLTERCHQFHHHHGVEIHISTIDVVLEYVRFLRRCHRHEEASSVLICLWTEYEEYDFESETIFLRLKIVGELMRTVRLLTVAVSVFRKCLSWFKAHSRHEHTRSCEVVISQTIEEIITTTTVTTTTTSITETVIREVFESTLSRSTVTSETITICKSLVSYYMKLEKWSEVIEVAKRSLLVIWRSFISGGGAIALPKDFGAGAIDIALSLALCHRHSHHFHEAEEMYIRVYRACRSSCHINDERLTMCSGVLINFYEEHHHWHKVIGIHEELLVEYRQHLGADHTSTIRTLYVLGSLCNDHGHGEASKYYVEIITTLNWGSDVCHNDALTAMFHMCRYHYEAGRWHELRGVCKVLWETWKSHDRGHARFTVDFVEVLYLRYRYVLEIQDRCEYSMLRELTIEYRDLCIHTFGAAVAIAIKASIELAQLCVRSEKYTHEAISIFEEVLSQTKSTKTTTTTTTVISTSTITSVKESLANAYTTVCSHSSVSSVTVERAITILLERYESLRVTLGWSHTETLICLRELVMLRMKLKSEESHTVVGRMLLEAIVGVINGEKHSRALHQAGEILGEIYLMFGLMEQGLEMIQDLRMRIITRTAPTHDKSKIKLDKSVGRVSLLFLVKFEQVIRRQTSVSYCELMANYLAESNLYETYSHSIHSKADIQTTLVHAGRLRALWYSQSRKSQIEVLEQHCVETFVKKWSIPGRHEIILMFVVGLLEEFGKHETRNVSVAEAACTTSIAKVKYLLHQERFQEAYEVALCGTQLINNERGYSLLQNVPYGFKLSALMAGRGLDKPLGTGIEPKLHGNMLELSRKIIREVLQACKDSRLDFVRFKLQELNDLVGLLGEQQNFVDLEWILDLLWRSREVQKKWKSEDIIDIGRRLVEVRFLNNHKSQATRLCEDICYNLRRVWGSLDPKTLEMSELLSQLYTSQGHYREAQGVHENILRLVVDGDDGDDRTVDTMDSEVARRHVELLKQSFLRLKGWDKSKDVYRDLIKELVSMPEYKGKSEWKTVANVDQWDVKEAPSESLGKYVPPQNWEFPSKQSVSGNRKVRVIPRKPGMGMKRATSNWGMGIIHRFLNGEYDHEEMSGKRSINGAVGNTATRPVEVEKPTFMGDEDGRKSEVE